MQKGEQRAFRSGLAHDGRRAVDEHVGLHAYSRIDHVGWYFHKHPAGCDAGAGNVADICTEVVRDCIGDARLRALDAASPDCIHGELVVRHSIHVLTHN